MDLNTLSAGEAAARIRVGEISSEELLRACLAHIEAREADVQAWAHLDPEIALTQARQCDELRQSGAALGPLHGVPVAVKDIFDSRDWPTENGSILDSGRRPETDCAVISLLQAAGAVIMGKTVTTEFAVFSPGKTRNPHNLEHTPGGSSSGSAASVADAMVPLAVGSQTNGSVIRPASFCGVVGFKPSHGRIPRTGVLALSRILDHVGVFARSVEDAALLADVLFAHDGGDPDTRPAAPAGLAATAAAEPPVTPTLAFVKTPFWKRADDECQAAFGELAEFLGEACEEVELPAQFEAAAELHRTIMCADLAKNLATYAERGWDQISETLRELLEHGRQVSAVDYNRAADCSGVLNAGLDAVFERCDAILTPAAPGAAPHGLGATGNPVFCTLWTYCGVPAVSLPLMQGENGLPIGVQLVGPRGGDARLLRTANWLASRVAAED